MTPPVWVWWEQAYTCPKCGAACVRRGAGWNAREGVSCTGQYYDLASKDVCFPCRTGWIWPDEIKHTAH